MLEVVSGRSVATGEDVARVIEGHGSDGIHKNLARGRSGGFRGAVHAENKIVHLWPITEHAQAFFQRLQVLGHENFDGAVGEISVFAAN